jgi:hypothetical protein
VICKISLALEDVPAAGYVSRGGLPSLPCQSYTGKKMRAGRKVASGG